MCFLLEASHKSSRKELARKMDDPLDVVNFANNSHKNDEPNKRYARLVLPWYCNDLSNILGRLTILG